MVLETYNTKRDFTATPEPKGKAARKGGNSYLIQKHAATRLHYDLRLELDGVLKSWAVTKGPSLDPSQKRLAVAVEDHPVAYGTFEGTIPKGEYGGGTVMLWDRGTWAPVGDAHKGLAKGHLEFTLDGEKLRGLWHLVRIKGKPGEKRENWLLIKGEDDWARAPDAVDVQEEMPLSVSTGRTMDAIATEAPGWSSKAGGRLPKAKAAPRAKLPDFVEPQLATLVSKPPQGDDWVHEIKFDGYRLQARIDGGRVTLLTRTGLDWTERFGPKVQAALASLRCDTALIDTELVVHGAGGASDFSALQQDLTEGRHDRFVLYAFDLLHLDGRDFRKSPLLERKGALKPLTDGKVLRFSEHFDDDGSLVLRHACRLSLEGVVSKRTDAAYRSGRGRSWLKSKCSARQEFVIGGFIPSTAGPGLVAALLLGVQEDAGLRYVGKVGTGFSQAVSRDLFQRLRALEQDTPPFDKKLAADQRRGAVMVAPELVAEVEFRAWTADGHLRHAAFRGLREDKSAKEVGREHPAGAAPGKETVKANPRPIAPDPLPRPNVTLTHPDRIYWPDVGVTKQGLADHYAEVWRQMGPHVVGRPLALLRCPEGINGQSFFQKHVWRGMHKAIRPVKDPKDPEPMVAIDDFDGMMALVQGAALEIHPWGSTLASWEKPDRIVMDLDPGEGVDWPDVVSAAHAVRERLQAAGLQAFVKTSGGKGLHVVAPLIPKATWPTVRVFCKALASSMAADDPDHYVATISKARRTGRILIDWLRNQRGATAVAAWSSRARPGAPVSVPVTWEELGDIRPDGFTIPNLPDRLAQVPDPWAEFFDAAKPLVKPR